MMQVKDSPADVIENSLRRSGEEECSTTKRHVAADLAAVASSMLYFRSWPEKRNETFYGVDQCAGSRGHF